MENKMGKSIRKFYKKWDESRHQKFYPKVRWKKVPENFIKENRKSTGDFYRKF